MKPAIKLHSSEVGIWKHTLLAAVTSGRFGTEGVNMADIAVRALRERLNVETVPHLTSIPPETK